MYSSLIRELKKKNGVDNKKFAYIATTLPGLGGEGASKIKSC